MLHIFLQHRIIITIIRCSRMFHVSGFIESRKNQGNFQSYAQPSCGNIFKKTEAKAEFKMFQRPFVKKRLVLQVHQRWITCKKTEKIRKQ